MPDICIWNRCNNNCLMCSNPIDFRNKDDSFLYSRTAVVSRIKTWEEKQKSNKENINLTGGEPTIHPEFLELVKEIRKILPKNKIVMATNGRMFSYSWFTKKYLAMNNLSLEIAIHGATPKLHNMITGVKGSFEQTIKGISNILKYRNSSQELELRIIITKLNYQYLDLIINLIKKEFSKVERVVLVFMEMEGFAEKNFKIVGLTYKELKPYLTVSKLKKWKEKLPEIRLYHFPLCTLPPELWEYTWRTLRGEEITFLSRCSKCLYKKYCLGIHKDYLTLVGDREFQPIRKKINIQTQDFFHHPIIKVKKPS